ncbi:MAG: radical SAM family heme chaperone HemW [Bacteroidales bacterium]|nr:radical SAM family heme chaperone HemW [Bacteroidales bacterium]
MAALYFHIPFCKTRCIYCDFYSNINLLKKDLFINALLKEIELRKNEIDEPIETIYFGGGTPSQLNHNDFKIIFNKISLCFDLSKCIEITLEANPEDMTDEYIYLLKDLPFNRISMGVQSFNDNELKFLNRRHSSSRAIEAVKACKINGFNNISIDLMYGLPNQTLESWKENISKAISLGITHISSYHLIYEEGTKMYSLLKKNAIKEVSEDLSLEMFKTLIETLKQNGFEHYEISNFAKNSLYSKHNTSYWQNKKYLGFGPSAHSYNLNTRCWNVSDLDKYIKGEKGEIEYLTESEHYDEFILTSLRTMWGISFKELQHRFDRKYFDYCITQSKRYIDSGLLEIKENRLILTSKGIFISDGIMSDLMYII